MKKFLYIFTSLLISILIFLTSTSSARAVNCTSIDTEQGCFYATECIWNSSASTCHTRADCSSVSTQQGCYYAVGCSWNSTASTCGSGGGSGGESGAFSSQVDGLNEAIGLDSESNLTTINGIISTFLPIIITLGGLVLFVMLIAGGFAMMTSVGDPKAADAGKKKITTAIVGFILLFMSYWIIQLLEIVLGITILG